MINPRLIGPYPRTPADSGPSATLRTVPSDLLREASRRLGIMCLLGAALWVLGTVLDYVTGTAAEFSDQGQRSFPQAVDLIAAVSVLISLALYGYTRNPTRDPRVALDLGLGYLILTGLALGLTIHWGHLPAGVPIFPVISWVGIAVLMFAAIIPSTPTKTLLAGLIAVSMNPLGMLIARARGTWTFSSPGAALLMHYPDYLIVGVAVVIASVVRRLGQQVAQARAMGSYELVELIGRGGMGEVYRATHRMLSRPAAIKLIRPEMLGAANSESAQLAITRLRREAEAAATLRSPHTVELYDFGVTDDQTFYLVMELLEGMTLEALVRKTGPVPANRAIHILRQVCRSLEEAHASGLVHRDIKPANIHLGHQGLEWDFVKVLDFGLVKSFTTTGTDDSLGTEAGLTPGTPAYMPPEIALGEAVDGRADLYSLGCVAYYLLTGRLVFEAPNGLQMIAKHLREPPLPPSRFTELSIPQELDRLVLGCLAKKPVDRPGSAAELSRALAAVDGEAWDEAQAMRWWRANEPAVAPAAV
jgi:tRNA A-37 threonylcarbamoyl transferase component Bud32